MSDLMDLTWMNPMGMVLWSEEGEPYESDLSESNGNLPMSWEWVYLSIWLDWSQWESPYVQLNECPYESDLEQPYGKVPMVDWECPYQSDLSKDDLTKHYQNEWNRWEMNELKWVEWIEVSRMNGWKWTRTTLWEWSYEWIERYPIKVTWCEWKSMSLSKWSESMRNELEWDRISEMRWNEWFDGKARRKSLWVEWRWTDGTDGTDGR